MNVGQQTKYADECKQAEPNRIVASPGMVMGAAESGGRQSAKGVIRDRARQLRNEADRLEALARALPEELPPQADQALWDLAIAARR